MKQTHHKSPTSIVQPAVGRFVVISSPCADDSLQDVKGDIEGTFDTRQQAEKYIRDEGLSNFELNGANEGRNEEWGSSMFICEVVAIRKAVPVVSIHMEVADAIPKNKHIGIKT